MIWIAGIIALLVVWRRIWSAEHRIHFLEGELYSLKRKTGVETSEEEDDFLEQYPGFLK